jgi:hypothetical protein
MEVRECSPPILKTSMAGPVGGDAEESVAPTTYLEDIDGGPLGGDDGDRERPPPILKTLMAGPIGGDDKGPGALNTYPKDLDGRPPGR